MIAPGRFEFPIKNWTPTEYLEASSPYVVKVPVVVHGMSDGGYTVKSKKTEKTFFVPDPKGASKFGLGDHAVAIKTDGRWGLVDDPDHKEEEEPLLQVGTLGKTSQDLDKHTAKHLDAALQHVHKKTEERLAALKKVEEQKKLYDNGIQKIFKELTEMTKRGWRLGGEGESQGLIRSLRFTTQHSSFIQNHSPHLVVTATFKYNYDPKTMTWEARQKIKNAAKNKILNMLNAAGIGTFTDRGWKGGTIEIHAHIGTIKGR